MNTQTDLKKLARLARDFYRENITPSGKKRKQYILVGYRNLHPMIPDGVDEQVYREAYVKYFGKGNLEAWFADPKVYTPQPGEAIFECKTIPERLEIKPYNIGMKESVNVVLIDQKSR